VIRTTHFGYKDKEGYGNTYIDHKNDNIKDAWIKRHQVNRTFENYMSVSSLARYILWEHKTLTKAISAYKRRFDLE
jgi:hypothetical protein